MLKSNLSRRQSVTLNILTGVTIRAYSMGVNMQLCDWRCRLCHTEMTGNDLINRDWSWRRWRLFDVVRVDTLLDDGRVVTTILDVVQEAKLL